jgi:curved DNA-binding protein
MPAEYKDYYKILGVPRGAGADEIRKAFRSLARQYHPDVARDKKNAEEKFKEINEAYEVLGDAEKRKKYDALGSDWNRPAGGPPPGYQSGRRTYSQPGGGDSTFFEFDGTGFSEFFEQVFGRHAGAGYRAQYAEEETAERGQDVEGDIMVSLEEAIRGAIRPISLRHTDPCSLCGGTGVHGRRACPECGGAGEISSTYRYQVKIPAGVRDGQRLRVAGQGERGEGGGPSGDLYLHVRLATHPDFRVEGDDLYYDLDLAPWEAVLGTRVSIPTPTGVLKIKIPAGTQTGQRLRIHGHGLLVRGGENGDLYVVSRIQVPRNPADREKRLWEQLAAESGFNPREE